MANESYSDVWSKELDAWIKRQAYVIQQATRANVRSYKQPTVGTAAEQVGPVTYEINSDCSVTYKVRITDTQGATLMKDVQRIDALKRRLLATAAAIQKAMYANRYAHFLSDVLVNEDLVTQRDCLARHVLRYLTLVYMSVDWISIPPPHLAWTDLPKRMQDDRKVIDLIPDIIDSLKDLTRAVNDELDPRCRDEVDRSLVQMVMTTITGHLHHLKHHEHMLDRLRAEEVSQYPKLTDSLQETFSSARGMFLQAARRTVCRRKNGTLRTRVMSDISDELGLLCSTPDLDASQSIPRSRHNARAANARIQMNNLVERKCEAALFKLQALFDIYKVVYMATKLDRFFDLIQEIYDESFPKIRRERVLEAKKKESADGKEA